MMATYTIIAMRQGRAARAVPFAVLAGTVVVLSFSLAVALGGATVTDRVFTLFASDPLTVYKGARGDLMTFTFFDLMYQYPLGAGLARWGMAAGYFGSSHPTSEAIWAEIQFTGWVIDGGGLMIAVYLGPPATRTLSEGRSAAGRRHTRPPGL